MNKIVSVALALGILLAGGGVFYHYVIFLPSVQAGKDALEAKKADEAEQAKVDAQQREIVRARAYTSCLDEAQSVYTQNWENSCTNRKLPVDCSLPSSTANGLEEFRKGREARCLAEARAGL